MSTFDDQPGGGFSEVKGYEPPAGSQAEQERQLREDAARQSQQEQAAYDAAQIEASQHSSPGSGGGTPRGSRPAHSRKNHVAGARAPAGRRTSTGAPSRANPRWNPVLATIGCVVTAVWVAGRIEGEHAWWIAGAVGLFVGWIVGRYYKLLIAVALLSVVVTIVVRQRKNEPVSQLAGAPESVVVPAPEPAPAAAPAAESPWPTIELWPTAQKPSLFVAPPPVDPSAILPGVAGTLFQPGEVDSIELSDWVDVIGTLNIQHSVPIDAADIQHVEYVSRFHRLAVLRQDGSRLDVGVTLDPDLDLYKFERVMVVLREYRKGKQRNESVYFMRLIPRKAKAD